MYMLSLVARLSKEARNSAIKSYHQKHQYICITHPINKCILSFHIGDVSARLTSSSRVSVSHSRMPDLSPSNIGKMMGSGKKKPKGASAIGLQSKLDYEMVSDLAETSSAGSPEFTTPSDELGSLKTDFVRWCRS